MSAKWGGEARPLSAKKSYVLEKKIKNVCEWNMNRNVHTFLKLIICMKNMISLFFKFGSNKSTKS